MEPGWCAKIFDIQFYRGVIDKDCGEISYAFPTGEPPKESRKSVQSPRSKIRPFIKPRLTKYPQIEPYIMPIKTPYSRSGGHGFPDRPRGNSTCDQPKEPHCRVRFNLSVPQNKPNLGLFLNGARYGLLLGYDEGNRRPYWARIKVGMYPACTQDTVEKASLSTHCPQKKH